MRTLASRSSLFFQLQSLLIFPACTQAPCTPTGHEPPSLLFLPLSSLPEEVRVLGTCTLTHAGCSFLMTQSRGDLALLPALSYFCFLKLNTVPNLLIIFSYHLLFRAYMAKALCARSLDTWQTSRSLSLLSTHPFPFPVAPYRVPFRPPEPLITRVIMCVCVCGAGKRESVWGVPGGLIHLSLIQLVHTDLFLPQQRHEYYHRIHKDNIWRKFCPLSL